MYVLLYFKHMAVFIVSSIIVYYVLKLITIKPGDNYLSFVGYSVIMVTLLVSVEGDYYILRKLDSEILCLEL